MAGDDDWLPLTVPVWYADQPSGNITFFTGTQGRTARKTGLLERTGKAQLLRAAGRVPVRTSTRGLTSLKANDIKPRAPVS
ncbi:hypothetical protein [Actinocrispum wychmicini]|uniref:hypothetical protein n=1 Tax=Actinocrispum wychmicini TaxID=1213861 RepID=UPI0010470B9E|nr:hypothetical protein [Actinocrispum wychmicini]